MPKTSFALVHGAVSRWLRALLCLLAGPVTLIADGNEVVLLFNRSQPGSEEVARHYAAQRSVPTNQILGFDFENSNYITRPAYMKFAEDFLIKELEQRGLAKFRRDIIPMKGDRPGRVKYLLTQASFRYLVPSFGVPWQIAEAPNWSEPVANMPAAVKRNEACLDNELSLLPRHGELNFDGPLRNPRFASTNAGWLHPTNGVIIVSRLDGPNMEIAKALVDKALVAEREGLWGRAYFDLRNLTNGAYAPGDRWITNCSTVARDVGFETVVDNLPAVLNNAFPLSQVALYFGWYEGHATGPFGLSSVEFGPGAVAYHLHSYSAGNPRSAAQNWVGPFLAKGVTFTMGCTSEPYLTFTPQVDVFLESLLKLCFTAGEAALNSLPVLSWQTLVVGDPLYRPGVRNPIEWAEELRARKGPQLDWAELRVVNLHLRTGRDPEVLRDYLVQLPLSRTSPVLSEKIADLFADKGDYGRAIQWESLAIKAGGSPQQRVRLLRNLAEWQRTFGQASDSLTSLSQFTLEFPGHPDLLPVRREQARLARELGREEQLKFFESELARLAPPSTNAMPATNAVSAGKAAPVSQ
jgi:uncharacterized protein (TIGR03790 family)